MRANWQIATKETDFSKYEWSGGEEAAQSTALSRASKTRFKLGDEVYFINPMEYAIIWEKRDGMAATSLKEFKREWNQS
jgi:hypothetical protein